MEISPPADAMDGVERPAEVKQEAPDEPEAAAAANGHAGSAENGAGKPAGVAAFWAHLAGDAGGKTAAADVKAANDTVEKAETDVQPPQESEAAAMTADGVADGAAQEVDANGDAAMGEEQAAIANGHGEVAAEEEEEV